MRRFLPLTALVLVLAAGSVAIAQQPGGPALKFGRGHGPAGFSLLEFDTNADGKLARAEFDAAQRARFDEMDGNKDGFVVREEMQTLFEARRAGAEKARFALLDTDRSGQLSEAEFAAAQERRRGGPGPRMGGRGGPDGPGGPGGFGRGARIGPDTDNDGRISFAEFSARGSEGFARADANKDGTVTIAELQAITRGPR